MCEPTAIIAGVGAVISIGGEIIGANEQQRKHEENSRQARESAKNATKLLGLRQMQEQKAAAQTIYQMDLEARTADAKTRVSAGESGVAGASIDALVADIERQRLMAEAGTRENAQGTVDQLNEEKKVVRSNSAAQVNSVASANPWATGLRIGGHTANAAASYASIRKQGAK